MKRTLAAMLLSTALTILPAAIQADEAEAKLQIETIATGLVPNLPSGKKVVLKTISPEDSGLPADFLRKLTSDLEAALLVASEFEIDLVNRQTTEEIWAEAIEFNNADFDALHAASGADVALMLSARATEGGVEIALTAYSLDTADAGKVLASSGSTLLALDMQQNVGVDVNSLNEQMAQVLAEIEKVGQTGGLISEAKTYAEFYHNARLLQQRGEVDLAMANYESAIKLSPFPFVDPVEDLISLAQTRYGTNHIQYVNKRLKDLAPPELFEYASLLADPKSKKLDINQLANKDKVFLPLIVVWLDQNKKDLEERIRESLSNNNPDYVSLFLLLEGARTYLQGLEEGRLQNFYIDKFRAKAALPVSDLRNIIDEFSLVTYTFFETDYELGTGFKYIEPACDGGSRCSFEPSPEGIPGLSMNAPGTTNEIVFEQGIKISEVKEIDFSKISWGKVFPPVTPEMLGVLKSTTIRSVYGNIFTPNTFQETLQPHLGPCGLVQTEVPARSGDLSSYARILSRSEETVAKDHEDVVAQFEPLLIADLCLKVLTESYELFSESQYGQPGQFIDTPKAITDEFGLAVHSNSNRLSNTIIQTNWSQWLPELDAFRNAAHRAGLYKINGIQGLLVTDSVDRTKSIKVVYSINEYIGANSWNDILGTIDITKDGTTFSPDGMPIEGTVRDQWKLDGVFASMQAVPNDWLYVPGVIQGSVGLFEPKVLGVFYTNKRGEQKFVTNNLIYLGGTGYGPLGPPGITMTDYCQGDITSTAPKHRSFNYELACGDVMEQFSTLTKQASACYQPNGAGDLVLQDQCATNWPGLPKFGSFTPIRRALFHTDLNLSFNMSDAIQSAEATSEETKASQAEPSWSVFRSYPPQVHLGDEEIGDWPSLFGQCMEVILPAVRQGGSVAITYEPYGLERAYLELPDGSKQYLPAQERRGGKRPNYWGENASYSLEVTGGDSPEAPIRICADFLEGADRDDFMLRNVQTWAFQ